MPSFNLHEIKLASLENPAQILQYELEALHINRSSNGYILIIGDEHVPAPSLKEAKNLISAAIEEIKGHIWDKWKEISRISDWIINSISENKRTKDNILFLNYLKKSILLSERFDDLGFAQESLKPLLYLDISEVDTQLIQLFNSIYLKIKSLHKLILFEMYRTKVINQYIKLSGQKLSQVSGPWANLDLPMKERVWEWDSGEEEYFKTRKKERREQMRYNPEMDSPYGFYYNWQDWTREPYRFEDMKKDSPYKSRHLLSIP